MSGLTKEIFDEKYRFREARGEGLVNCVTCDNISGGATTEESPAYCEHKDRFRRIKIAEYWEGFWGEKGTSHNIASKRVCDGYKSKPLPEGVEIPILPRKHAILLETQWRDPYHGDSNCPYVIEELRAKHEGRKVRGRVGVDIIDNRDMVTGSTIRDICEMPCCESKLPYQIISNPNGYRRKVGIKPDGSEPKVWVRNGIVKHEKKVEMNPEEAEAVFDLERFNSSELGVHEQIIKVSDYLRENCNRLGSRPLSRAVNPVWSNTSDFHVLKSPLAGYGSDIDFWIYDKRLFNPGEVLVRPLSELDKIPEGLIPCIDPERSFSGAVIDCERHGSGSFSFYGILLPFLLLKRKEYFLKIGAVSYYGSFNHMWGEFGKGFGKSASFHEQ